MPRGQSLNAALKSHLSIFYRFQMMALRIPPPLRELLATPDPPDLGSGPRQDVQSRAALDRQIDDALKSLALAGNRAELLRATILLWHDHFDPAHTIAQAIENADGSYVHAILHRREPDYSNAKYWFRRVGPHPCFPRLAAAARTLLQAAGDSALESKLLRNGDWDSFAFVDACEAAATSSGRNQEGPRLREIQRAEFDILLENLSRGESD
jgi:hypothetical protein